MSARGGRRERWLSRLILAAALVLGAASLDAAEDEDYFDAATGYRIERYRAPTPLTVPGGQRLTLDGLDELMAAAAPLLVDVMASDGAGLDPSTGQWRMASSRRHIPSSVWLPDVGKGRLSPQLDIYFRTALDRLTNGDLSRPIVIYCLADCWMGWNAVRRAASYSYTAVYWYPDGTDGWRDWDRPLVPAVALPLDLSATGASYRSRDGTVLASPGPAERHVEMQSERAFWDLAERVKPAPSCRRPSTPIIHC